jgi:hypothetical protein
MLNQTRRLFGFENVKPGTGNYFFNTSFILREFPHKVRLEFRSRSWYSMGVAVRKWEKLLAACTDIRFHSIPKSTEELWSLFWSPDIAYCRRSGNEPLVTMKTENYVALIKMRLLAWKTLASVPCRNLRLIRWVSSKNTDLINIIISIEGIPLKSNWISGRPCAINCRN